jgi:preprotein translocase subunit SecB
LGDHIFEIPLKLMLTEAVSTTEAFAYIINVFDPGAFSVPTIRYTEHKFLLKLERR